MVPKHRSIRWQPVTPVQWLRCIRTKQEGPGEENLSITGYTGDPMTRTGLFTKSFTREHVTRVKNFSTSPVAWKHAPVHSHSHWSQAMQLDFKETLQHRIHRCLLGTCTDASLTDCALIQMSMATIWIQCDRINRCYSFGLSGACDFCVECSQRLGVPLHSI